MPFLKTLLSSAAHLFYPCICTGCGSDLLSFNRLLCAKCLDDLPHTGFEKYPLNPVERIFFGRINLVAAHSEFFFSKGELIQHLIHELKYKGNKEIGVFLGGLAGGNMFASKRFSDADFILALPMFAEKEYKRGFNQAEVLAEGMSIAMNIPHLRKNLVRVRATETQTKKHRAERWENVSGSFTLKNPEILEDKHVLLVDDVITTGATLEAAGQILMQVPGLRLSLATLAVVSK